VSITLAPIAKSNSASRSSAWSSVACFACFPHVVVIVIQITLIIICVVLSRLVVISIVIFILATLLISLYTLVITTLIIINTIFTTIFTIINTLTSIILIIIYNVLNISPEALSTSSRLSLLVGTVLLLLSRTMNIDKLLWVSISFCLSSLLV
jgi:hypothetical protein